MLLKMIQLYVIFHKTIFDECYKSIPADILYKYFTFIAVNQKIPKQYTQNKYKILNEWDLPIYDPTLQERGFNENSAIYHVYANNLHKDYKYIGFFQYDMEFTNNIVEFLQNHITETPRYFPLHKIYSFDFCFHDTWFEPDTLVFFIKEYCNYFKVLFTRREEYALYNTFVIPIETFEKIMPWITQLYDKMYPWCNEAPNRTHFGHVAGVFERIMAFALAEEGLPYVLMDVKHDHKYKNICNS